MRRDIMAIEHLNLSSIDGPLVVVDGVREAAFGDIVRFRINQKEEKIGQVISIEGEKCLIQVFDETTNMSLNNTHTTFSGHGMEIELAPEILGRTFDGIGRPLDNLGPIHSEIKRDVNGFPLNPVSRVYPKDFLETGFSAIDGLTTLVRGQKLPIFSGEGLSHNELAAQIVKQAKLGEDVEGEFALVFAAMGVTHDTADFFRRTFEESGTMDHVTTFLNTADDPVMERIITPKVALTTAEYLAYDLGYHVLVIMTDMTSFSEALREISNAKDEIPSRKGYPGYLYSELATIYERAGIVKGRNGSVTQIPILTMPNDDITHPIPDLTGYITEGQIVLDRDLQHKNIFPPIGVLPSLSRLMSDSIGAEYTREDHEGVANQLFASYSNTMEARSLASVIGEEELSDVDKMYITFGAQFEEEFVGQGKDRTRSMEDTLNLGWDLLRLLPSEELDRIDSNTLDKYYANKEYTFKDLSHLNIEAKGEN